MSDVSRSGKAKPVLEFISALTFVDGRATDKRTTVTTPSAVLSRECDHEKKGFNWIGAPRLTDKIENVAQRREE